MNQSKELEAYLTGRWLTDFSNFAAFVFHGLPDLNWAGFYLDHDDKLYLANFVGKPACTEISYARGVCGAAFTRRESLLVPDVNEFPGHIACDSASRSEMVIPLLVRGQCLGVFDLDSPLVNRFTDHDRAIAEQWLKLLLERVFPEGAPLYPWKATPVI